MKWWHLLVAAALGAALALLLWPSPPEPPIPLPVIVTHYDTVRTPPESVFIHGPKVVTTDTVNLVETVTLHDTVTVYVGPDTTQRPALWPILSLTVGAKRGDTTRAATFSLRSGLTTTSSLWTPGPLAGVWADSSGVPRMQFYPPPVCTVPFMAKAKAGAVGAGIYELLRLLFGHP